MTSATGGIFSLTRYVSVRWAGDLPSGTGVIETPDGTLSGAAITFPSRTGRVDDRTSPGELIEAAHAGCFAMSTVAALANAEVPSDAVTVQAGLTLSRVEGALRLTEAQLTVTVHGQDLNETAGTEIVSQADLRCPVSAALRASMPVTIATCAEGAK